MKNGEKRYLKTKQKNLRERERERGGGGGGEEIRKKKKKEEEETEDVFARMPCESYRRRLRPLLYLSYVFRALISSLMC